MPGTIEVLLALAYMTHIHVSARAALPLLQLHLRLLCTRFHLHGGQLCLKPAAYLVLAVHCHTQRQLTWHAGRGGPYNNKLAQYVLPTP